MFILFLLADARIVDETIPITDVIPRDPNDKYTALFKHDVTSFGFYHPPCVTITAAASSMYIVVRGKYWNWSTADYLYKKNFSRVLISYSSKSFLDL